MTSTDSDLCQLHIRLVREQLKRIKPPLLEVQVDDFVSRCQNDLGFFIPNNYSPIEMRKCEDIAGLSDDLKVVLGDRFSPWYSWIHYNSMSPLGMQFESRFVRQHWLRALKIVSSTSSDILGSVHQCVIDGTVHQSYLRDLEIEATCISLLGPTHYASTVPLSQFVRSKKDFLELQTDSILDVYRRYQLQTMSRKVSKVDKQIVQLLSSPSTKIRYTLWRLLAFQIRRLLGLVIRRNQTLRMIVTRLSQIRFLRFWLQVLRRWFIERSK